MSIRLGIIVVSGTLDKVLPAFMLANTSASMGIETGMFFSFYGIIDFLSVIPTYLSLVIVGSHSLMIIRVLRLLRVFRILKLTRYTQAGSSLARALWNSRAKISVFIFFVSIIVIH